MYERLTVDLLDLHPPTTLNANSFSFHVVSRKYIPSYAIFHGCVEQFYDATWVGVNNNWMPQLLYEWQKFMNSTYPFLFSNPWLSYTFQQPWEVSNNFAMVNVCTKPTWMCIYRCLIHIRDHCEWSKGRIMNTFSLVVDHEVWKIGWYIETRWEFIKPRNSTRLFPHLIVWG